MKKNVKDYFIPHKGNDYKPHSLQKAAVLGMTLMVLLSFALTNLQSVLWISSDWLVSTILPAVIVDLTNNERGDGSLGFVRRSSILDQAAQLKAQHMAANEYFAHNSPEGITPWYWFGEAGYNFVHAGENLAIHFTDSGDVVQAWMDSPTHRANIMNGNFTEIGIGTAEGEYEGFKTIYVVQLFGAPAASTAVAGEVTTVTPVAQASEINTAFETIELAPSTEVLAESAAITETVEFIEAEPQLVAVEKEILLETEKSTTTNIEEMEVTETGVALYSDFVSTSTGGVPATIEPTASPEPIAQNVSWLGRILTSPHVVLEILYSVIALFVVGALLLAIFIEIRRQEPVQVAYAFMLLFLMYGLFELHTLLSGGALVV